MPAESADPRTARSGPGLPSELDRAPLVDQAPAGDAALPSWLDDALPEPPGTEAAAPPTDDAALPSWLDDALPEPAETKAAAPRPPSPAPAPAAKPAASPAPVKPRATKVPAVGTAAVALDAIAPTPEQGGSVVYGMTARNTSATPLHQFWVEHELPPGVRFLRGVPTPEFQDHCLVWKLGTLPPGAQVPLEVHVQAAVGPALTAQATASFHAYYTKRALIQTRILKPQLEVTAATPPPVVIGRHVDLWMEIGNRGNCPVDNALLRICLPAGLHHPRGPEIESRLGSLAAGTAKKVKLRVTARQPGTHTAEIAVTGADELRAAAQARVAVHAAELTVQLTGPARCLLERTIDYRLEVANPGTAPAENIHVTHLVPPGLAVMSADGGPAHDAAANCLSWTIAHLAAGQRVAYPIQLKATKPGDYRHQLAAQGDDGLQATAEVPVSNEFSQHSRFLEEVLSVIDRDLAPEAQPAEEAGASAPVGREERHLIFTLADTDYAVPLANVMEIGRPLAITPMPNTPDWLLGVANVRGDIISVILLSRFLGIETGNAEHVGRLVVARSREQETTTGFIVEQVRGIRSLPSDRIRTPTSPIEDRVARYLRGVSEHAGRLLVVLELERLLLSSEMKQFEAV